MESPPSQQDIDKLVAHPASTPKQLQEAFALFSAQADELQKSYPMLDVRFLKATSQLAMAHDQLNQKLTQLNHTRFYLQALIDNISEGLIFIDVDKNLTVLSERARTLLRLEEPACGCLYSRVFSDQFFGFSISQQLAQRSGPIATTLTLSPKALGITPSFLQINSRFIDLENKQMSKLSRQSNALQGLLILVRDISELERLQAINQRNERLKELGELAATMAHEIRNPLAAIEGFACLLKNDLKGDEKKVQMSQSIIEASRQLNKMVGNILHYARPLTLHIHYQDIQATVQQAVDMANVSGWLGPHHKLVWHASGQSILVAHDKELLKSSLLHLIKNALQAVGERGSVRVDLRQIDKHVEVTVTDDGHGIEPHLLDKIFLPLFTTKSEGNGLGLCEVSKMSQAQGGTVEAFSTLHKGSSFCIKLPIQSPLTQ